MTMATWAPPPPVLVRPAKIVGYLLVARERSRMLVREPIPWLPVKPSVSPASPAAIWPLFTLLEGARSYLRIRMTDHLMICEKTGVNSGYDIAIQAVKEDGTFETIEIICTSIDMEEQIV